MRIPSIKLFAVSLCMTKFIPPQSQLLVAELSATCRQHREPARDPSDTHPGKHVPVLIETSSALITDVLSKNSLEIPQALWCIYVSHNSHHHHWWGLNDGHSLHLFPLGDPCKIAKGRDQILA